MNKIKYQVLSYRTVYDEEKEENTQIETMVTIEMPYSPGVEEVAKSEAYNGEYTIEDDGEEEPTGRPNLEDRVNTLEADTADLAEALDMILNGVTE
jgi:hypothetical protein